MKLQSAIFYSRDIDVAEKFYASLGLGTNFSISGAFISLSFPDGGRLEIKRAKEEREMPGFQTVHVEVEDVQKLYHFVAGLGIHLKDGIKPHPDGGKYFAVFDPDRNKLVFIEPAAA